MEPAQIREGLVLLRDMAQEKKRDDVYNKCCSIINMTDDTLRARQCEVKGLKFLGLNPIKYGYLEAAIGVLVD